MQPGIGDPHRPLPQAVIRPRPTRARIRSLTFSAACDRHKDHPWKPKASRRHSADRDEHEHQSRTLKAKCVCTHTQPKQHTCSTPDGQGHRSGSHRGSREHNNGKQRCRRHPTHQTDTDVRMRLHRVDHIVLTHRCGQLQANTAAGANTASTPVDAVHRAT